LEDVINIIKSVLLILILVTLPLVAQAQITLPGLYAPVTVQRNANGVPHINAGNEHDLFFMQGRIHAEDRLFQMDLLRRSAAGTRAELLGPGAIQTDVEARTIGLHLQKTRSPQFFPSMAALDTLIAVIGTRSGEKAFDSIGE